MLKKYKLYTRINLILESNTHDFNSRTKNDRDNQFSILVAIIIIIIF